jgi:hypothetical protein
LEIILEVFEKNPNKRFEDPLKAFQDSFIEINSPGRASSNFEVAGD